MSRAYTKEEMQQRLLDHVRMLAKYWANLPGDKTVEDRCDGLAFSILSALDGSSMNLPAVDLVLQPHPDDKAYCQKSGENWVEPGMVLNEGIDLHDLYYKHGH